MPQLNTTARKAIPEEQSPALYNAINPLFKRGQAVVNTPLYDVTDQAKQYGFVTRLELTPRVFEACVFWDNQDSINQNVQIDSESRLKQLLYVSSKVMRSLKALKNQGTVFSFYRIPRDGISRASVEILLKIKIDYVGKEPVTTILLPTEDFTDIGCLKLGSLADLI